MVDQIDVITFSTPLTTGLTNLVVSPNITETVKAVLFFWNADTTESSDINHGNVGMGACTSNDSGGTADEYAYATQGSNANRTTTDYNTVRSATSGANAACIVITSGTSPASVQSQAQFDSVIAGGVRVNFTVASASIRVTAVIFAGISDAAVKRISTAGSEDIGTTPFFSPDCVIFFGGGGGAGTSSTDLSTSLGFAVNSSPIQQVSMSLSHDDAVATSDADAEVATDDGFCNFQGTRVIKHGNITSFDSTGFDWTAPDGTITSMLLALKFSDPTKVRLACAAMATPGSAGVTAFNSFGFTPDVVIGALSPMTSIDTQVNGAAAGAMGFFVTGRYGSSGISVHGQEGLLNSPAAPYNTHNRSEDALICYEHTGTIAQRATWAGGSGAGGFSLNFSAAASGYMVALGIQIIPTHVIPRRQEARLATRTHRIARRTVLPQGVAVAPQVSSLVWRAVQRFRRKAQEVLRWRPRPELPLTVNTTPSATGQEVEGGVFVAGADRAQILSGGAEEGAVL